MRIKEFRLTRGEYRGIPFEINHPDNGYSFAYYVYLNLEHFEDKQLAESLWVDAVKGEFRKIYRMEKIPFLNDIYFHGGLTWYSKSFSLSDDRVVKAGCDYGHDFDQYRFYDIHMVLEEVKRTINDIHDSTKYLMYCNGCGELVSETEGRYDKHGCFWSNGCISKHGMEKLFSNDMEE